MCGGDVRGRTGGAQDPNGGTGKTVIRVCRSVSGIPDPPKNSPKAGEVKEMFEQAIVKFLGGLLIVGLLLFLPAGTFAWRQAWLLIAILFIPMFLAGLIMMTRD